MPRGALTIVGTGIQLGTQITAESRAVLEQADEVLYLLADPVMMDWVERLNPNARSLHTSYEAGTERTRTYEAIVEQILQSLRKGGNVCAAFYGHPGVFVDPAHAAIRRARAEGFEAKMLPAVSAQDCLFADLGVDPAGGCQMYEATDFFLRKRSADPSAALILWQIGTFGNVTYVPEGDTSRIPVLVGYLRKVYPADHEVVLYEASPYPVCDAFVERVRLSELPELEISPMVTLYVPPIERGDIDREMAARLDLERGATGTQ